MSDFFRPLTRREFVQAVGLTAGASVLGACAAPTRTTGQPPALAPEYVNDIHSQLNRTRVSGILHPQDEDAVASIVRRAAADRRAISLCGGRHAGGGQQFLSDHVLVDLHSLECPTTFDAQRGHLAISAGAFWPAVYAAIDAGNRAHGTSWAINQKQGGSDFLSLGGAVAANIHGRSLHSAPIVQDIESLRIVLPDGQIVTADRRTDTELFNLAVGGYGLWGVVTQVTLRLQERRKLTLRVERVLAPDVIAMFETRRLAGATYGDWQFAIDSASPQFLNDGVLSTYAPAPDDTPLTRPAAAEPSPFVRFATLAHQSPEQAFERYMQVKRSQDGQVDFCDFWQMSDYVPDYHASVDRDTAATTHGSEVLSEFYVRRDQLPEFLARSAAWLRSCNARLIYGVVRLIKRDNETRLVWARDDQACVIFNLHAADIRDPAPVNAELRGIAQIAVDLGGRFYLTYGRFADGPLLLKAYPQLPEVLAAKRTHDPRGTFQSNWYRWVEQSIA